MAENINQRILDLLVAHDVELLRVLDGIDRVIESRVRRITLDLIGMLSSWDPTQPVRAEFGRRRVARLVKDGKSKLANDYRKLYREIRQQLIDIALAESVFFTENVNKGIGVQLAVGEMTRAGARLIIDKSVIQANANDAETLRGFFEREAGSTHRRWAGALQQGFREQNTLPQLIQRIRDTGGIAQRETTAIGRTAFNHITNQSRLEMMQRNSSLFRGAIWVSILDANTTPVCISRSNAIWDLNTGRPFPESPVQTRFPGPPPAHFGCRSHLYPLTKTARQIGRASQRGRRAIASLPREQRQLLNADPPRKESYPEWLRRQPENVQVTVLGRGRRELWLAGKLSLRDLVTQRGRPLTLKELARRRERAA